MNMQHPALVMNCTSEERDAFNQIANGAKPEEFDVSIVESLKNKALLDEDSAGDLTIPVLVFYEWQEWNKQNIFKKENVQ